MDLELFHQLLQKNANDNQLQSHLLDCHFYLYMDYLKHHIHLVDQLDLKLATFQFYPRTFTKKLGETWQYTAFMLSFSRVIVYPPTSTKACVGYIAVTLWLKSMCLQLQEYQYLNDNLKHHRDLSFYIQSKMRYSIYLVRAKQNHFDLLKYLLHLYQNLNNRKRKQS